MRRIATALFLSAVTFALAAPAYASTGHMITVKAKDFSFALSAKTVPHGKVTFVIDNVGHTTHDFAIAGHTSARIGPGKSTPLVVTLEHGSFPYKCTVDSHTKLGMKGTLAVT